MEIQVVYSYFTLTKTSDTERSAKLLFQKMEIGDDSWIVKNLYGTEDVIVAKVSQGDCSICFVEKADVVSLPCRHLAIGVQCAEKIRKNKEGKNARDCPVCRMSR